MTVLEGEAKVAREVTNQITGEIYIVTMTPEGLYMRIKGTRTSYLVPWGRAFMFGARLAADAVIAERHKRR